jgi:hypothetical protein
MPRGTLLAPVKRCVLGPLRAQAAEGRCANHLPGSQHPHTSPTSASLMCWPG